MSRISTKEVMSIFIAILGFLIIIVSVDRIVTSQNDTDRALAAAQILKAYPELQELYDVYMLDGTLTSKELASMHTFARNRAEKKLKEND